MSSIRIIANTHRGTFIFELLLVCTLLLLSNYPVNAKVNSKSYPNVPLVNQDGKILRFYDDVIKGKVVSINFMFTSCSDSCPLETAKLRKLQKLLGDHLGKNVFMYSITVDPERDTPAVLKTYMKKFNIGSGWQFLTGKKEDIDLIRKKLGMYTEDEDELSDHHINFMLGNETTGQWLKRTPFDLPETLVAVLLGRLQTRSLVALPSYTKSKSRSAANTGEDLFNTRCQSCHTLGQGNKLGPDLLGVVSRRDRNWLIRWLLEPDVMLDEKDPLAIALYLQYNKLRMPNIKLERRDALDLIQYMQDQTRLLNMSVKASPKQLENRVKAKTVKPIIETP
jgi:protein SCO1/2